MYVSHHALSLKEMGAVPGGAFKTFWEPVYRMSIPENTIQTPTEIGNWGHQITVKGFVLCPRETGIDQNFVLNLAGP